MSARGGTRSANSPSPLIPAPSPRTRGPRTPAKDVADVLGVLVAIRQAAIGLPGAGQEWSALLVMPGSCNALYHHLCRFAARERGPLNLQGRHGPCQPPSPAQQTAQGRGRCGRGARGCGGLRGRDGRARGRGWPSATGSGAASGGRGRHAYQAAGSPACVPARQAAWAAAHRPWPQWPRRQPGSTGRCSNRGVGPGGREGATRAWARRAGANSAFGTGCSTPGPPGPPSCPAPGSAQAQHIFTCTCSTGRGSRVVFSN